MHLKQFGSTKMTTTKTESYMKNPRKRTTVTMAAGDDELHVFDHQQQQAYALNTTSALVLQHCDGQTTPEQLMELLRQDSNVSHAQAEQLTWLALDELGKANLLEAGVARPRPPSSNLTRRQMLTTFATAGVALAVVPMVALVTTQARAEALPATTNGDANDVCLKRNGLYNWSYRNSCEASQKPSYFIIPRVIQNIWQESQIFICPGDDQHSVGRCSASFLCYQTAQGFYTDISNYLSVDNGLIVSWFTPTTLINLELDNIIMRNGN